MCRVFREDAFFPFRLTSHETESYTMASPTDGSHWQFILHGGCGEGCPDAHRQQKISRHLCETGEKISAALAKGMMAKDAVALAISTLEDCPVFNAGHGAALNQEGIHQVSSCNFAGTQLRKTTENLLHSLKRASSMVSRLIMVPSFVPRRLRTQSCLRMLSWTLEHNTVEHKPY